MHGQGRAARSTTLIAQVAPLLEPGDILIDGGNTHFPDTTRRMQRARRRRACSTSAPASPAARRGRCKGPSIMPGGDADGVAARQADLPGDRRQGTPDGEPVLRLGRPGGGRPLRQDGPQRHRVRRHAAHLRVVPPPEGPAAASTPTSMQRGLRQVEQGRARQLPDRDHRATSSATRDPETGKPLVDLILDTAGQKGTGKWTVNAAPDLGVPLTLIAEAVFARCLSAQKDERVAASQGAGRARDAPVAGRRRQRSSTTCEMALYARKIISLRPGLRPDAAQAARSRAGAEQRRHRADVARRLVKGTLPFTIREGARPLRQPRQASLVYSMYSAVRAAVSTPK